MQANIVFEKIVGGGKALGYLDGRPCFAVGPLPGEAADVRVVREKPGFVEANVVQFTTVSEHRGEPVEAHFLECSPWQGVKYDYQLGLKKQMLAEAFGRLKMPVTEMVGASAQLGYRNKLEFSLVKSSDEVSLAFHGRGSYEDLVALPQGCALGSAAMNTSALALVERVQALKLAGYVETVTVRQSVLTGQVLGVVALHQVPKRDFRELMGPELAGLVVARVRHRDAYEMVWHEGITQLTERTGGLDLVYPYNSFFQTNPAMFELALERILKHVPSGVRLADLYGGVGTIGLAAAGTAREVIGVEVNADSVALANANADRNGILNYTAECVPAEGMDMRVLRGADCVVVDPPRAGLHRRVVEALLEARPERIIYLSCNPATQVRDVALLLEGYAAKGVTGFDFYPGTLHLESLVVLDRIT